MRVKMRTTIANAKITAIAGSVIDVTEKEAEELLKGGYAEQIKAAPVKAAAKQEANEETETQPTEKPDNKAGGKKGK
jgi:hypothetical protein